MHSFKTHSRTWRAYGNTNPITSSRSTWACGTTEAVATNVLAQVCAVRSQSGGYVQAAVIVRNKRSGLFGAAAHLEMYDHNTGDQLNEWNCASSGVAAHSWSVCFGETFPWAGLVSASGSVNNYNLYWSPDV